MVRNPTLRAFLGLALAASLVVGLATIADAGPLELTEFDVPTANALPHAIVMGPDGAMWFTERLGGALGRIDSSGAIVEVPVSGVTPDPTALAAGPTGIWFTERSADVLGLLAGDGSITELSTPSAAAGPAGIALGPDGAMWFTERNVHRIGRVDPDGSVSELPAMAGTPGPLDITAGPDGAMWFTEQRASAIGRVTMQGVVTHFPIGVASASPSGIVAGPDGALWFGLKGAGAVGRMTTGGVVTTFPVQTAGGDPSGVAVGADGAIWFTEPATDVVGRITTGGAMTERSLPTVGASPFGIAGAPDGSIWFTEGGADRIGRLAEPPTPPDTTAPSIEIVTPAQGTIVTTGSALAADFSCTDGPGGSGLAACVGTVDAGSQVSTAPGAHEFAVDAADVAGNTAHASTSYLAFTSLSGSTASGTERAGMWATLEAGMGARLPKDVADVLAADYPTTQQVSCADPSSPIGASTPADARASTRLSDLVVRWRTDRAWEGTCRTLTLRFVASGWTGVDAVFLVRF